MAAKLIRTGAQMREARVKGIPIELPGGDIVYLRPVAPESLMRQGELLDILTPLVSKMLFEGADASAETIEKVLGEASKTQENDPAKLKEAMVNLNNLQRVCDIVCRTAFVSPRIVDDPQAEDEICIEDLMLNDKVHVLTLALGGARALQHFRYEPNADVDPLPDSQGNEQSTELAGVRDGAVDSVPA